MRRTDPDLRPQTTGRSLAEVLVCGCDDLIFLFTLAQRLVSRLLGGVEHSGLRAEPEDGGRPPSPPKS